MQRQCESFNPMQSGKNTESLLAYIIWNSQITNESLIQVTKM